MSSRFEDIIERSIQERRRARQYVPERVSDHHTVMVIARNPQVERQMFANGMVTHVKKVENCNKWICTLRTGQKMELSADPAKMPWAIGYQT
jgi:hypothetical protein